MQIEVIANVDEARKEELSQKTVLVIDVLRATSNIVTGLDHGAAAIIPVETVKQARSMKQEQVLIGGERFCRKPDGFDLGNSPYEYMKPEIKGKTIVMTTTNGTRAIQKAQGASAVIVCSFLNVRACALAALDMKRDVTILCAGTQSRYSLEDGLCAGAAIHEMFAYADEEPDVDDLGLTALLAFRSVKSALPGALLASRNGIRLSKLGYRDDVLYCARLNRCELTPVLDEGRIVPYVPTIR